jgi:hypothetical protein
MSAPLHCFGALALEIAAPPRHALLARDAADALGQLLSLDLQRLLPGIDALDLAFAAAHFDPCELLRPGWPVHAALSELAQRAPGRGGGRVIGFGAHAGAMPATSLQPEPKLFGGPLRLLPFALLGEAAAVAEVGRAMESRLLETGMAGAATALYAQEHFGGRLEHARYLSLHDLCAMTAMQYEHAGLGALWPLIEAALLAPGTPEWLDVPREPLARWNGDAVVIAEREGSAVEAGNDVDGLPDAGFDSPDANAVRLRRRQFEAVLGAHGIEVRRHVVAAGIDPRVALREPVAGAR